MALTDVVQSSNLRESVVMISEVNNRRMGVLNFLMTDSEEKEAKLKDIISDRLEEKGYLAYIRSEIKKVSLATARSLADSGKIEKTNAIKPPNLDGDADPILYSLILEMLEHCHLEQIKEALELEVGNSVERVDLSDALQMINGDKSKPYLLQIIEEARSHE